MYSSSMSRAFSGHAASLLRRSIPELRGASEHPLLGSFGLCWHRPGSLSLARGRRIRRLPGAGRVGILRRAVSGQTLAVTCNQVLDGIGEMDFGDVVVPPRDPDMMCL